MRQPRKIVNVFALLFNVLIIAGVIWAYLFGMDASYRLSILKFFTVLSNMFVALAALICIPFNIIGIAKNKGLPTFVFFLKQAATVAVSLTMFTVIFFLAPQDNWDLAKQFGNFSFTDIKFFMHLIVPCVSIISFIFFDVSTRKTKLWTNILVLIPPILYGAFYLINYFQGWFTDEFGSADWYGFIKVGGSPLFASLIFLGCLAALFLLSLLYWFLNGLIHKAKKVEALESSKEEVQELPEEQQAEELEESEPTKEEELEEEIEEEPIKEEPQEEEQVEEEAEPEQEEPQEEEKQPEEEKAEPVKKEAKPAQKKETKAKEAAPKKAAPNKKEEKAEPNKAEKKEAKAEPKKEEKTKVYHLTKRKEDNMWAITFVGGTKAVKLFKTKKEAEAALEVLTKNQGATALIRNSKGAKAGKFASSIKSSEKDK